MITHHFHIEYILTPLQKDIEHVDVAVKELRNALSEETDYNPETSWWLEVAALRELSELEDNHLIRPISAFKWQASQYSQTHTHPTSWTSFQSLSNA